MWHHPVPSKPKPRGRSLPSSKPGGCEHTGTASIQQAVQAVLLWCHCHHTAVGQRQHSAGMAPPHSAPAPCLSKPNPTPAPHGCLLGTEDAHGQAGLPCVSRQGRDVPRLTHIAPRRARPPGSRSCSGDHFTQRFHLTDQRH